MNGELIKRLGATSEAVGVSVRAWLYPEVARYALGKETTEIHGRCVGLTDEQINLVMSTMLGEYGGGGIRPNWDDIRSRMTLLAMDLEWRP